MKIWIAREKCGHLYLHKRKPYNEDGMWFNHYDGYMKLPTKDFPEVTFENSPMEVEIKLIEK